MAGYAIEFPKFDSAKSYKASYKLANLPYARREHALVLLRYNESGLLFSAAQRMNHDSTATFRFTIGDQKGRILHSATIKASDAILTQTQSIFGVYKLGDSYFRFQRDASYVLNVSYTPGTVPPPAKELYFAIDNCGFY